MYDTYPCIVLIENKIIVTITVFLNFIQNIRQVQTFKNRDIFFKNKIKIVRDFKKVKKTIKCFLIKMY